MRACRYILLIAILLISTNTYGQEFSLQKNSSRNLQIGLTYSRDANLSSDRITFDQNSGYNTDYNQSNFTAGFNLQYFFRQNLALYSGLSYSSQQFDGNFYCLNCFITGDQVQKFSLQFLQIPTAVTYYPYQNNIGLFGKIGVMNHFLLKKPYNRLEGNIYSISALLGAGLDYRFGTGFKVQLSAEYTSGLSEIFKEVDYTYKILGFQISMVKQL